METKNWYAYINLQPPKPYNFYVTGKAYAPSPGYEATLQAKEPQGKNTQILILDLFINKIPGDWITEITWIDARYDEEFHDNPQYSSVEIYFEEKLIVTVDVETAR